MDSATDHGAMRLEQRDIDLSKMDGERRTNILTTKQVRDKWTRDHPGRVPPKLPESVEVREGYCYTRTTREKIKVRAIWTANNPVLITAYQIDEFDPPRSPKVPKVSKIDKDDFQIQD